MPIPGDRFHAVYIGGLRERQWAIEDNSINGDNLLKDWRRKGAFRTIWHGYKEEAEQVAAQLCKDPSIVDNKKVKRQDTPTRTNAILNRQRARTRDASAVLSWNARKFTRCQRCGKMVKGEHEC
jgi:hypothetical protein